MIICSLSALISPHFPFSPSSRRKILLNSDILEMGRSFPMQISLISEFTHNFV